MAARRRAMLLHASWRPLLAGALGAGLVIGAVALAMPRFAYREVEIPRVILRDTVVPNILSKDVTVPNIVTKDVEIAIPRLASPSPLAKTPKERFTGMEEWRDADARGRILREDRNGFVLQTDEGEKAFYPAKIGANGKVEPNTAAKDVVAGLIGALAFCRPMPPGVFECIALRHDGTEVVIKQVPVGEPL
jgi:hypothetical protein